MPLQAKVKFHGNFPNNDISTKEIDHWIRSQYRIIKKIHSEKITNTESLFKFLDKEGTNISRVLDYNMEDNPNKIYKLIIIAIEDMYN